MVCSEVTADGSVVGLFMAWWATAMLPFSSVGVARSSACGGCGLRRRLLWCVSVVGLVAAGENLALTRSVSETTTSLDVASFLKLPLCRSATSHPSQTRSF